MDLSYFFSRIILNNSKQDIILSIPKTEREFSGVYKLILSNPNGVYETSANCLILAEPGRPEGPLTVTEIPDSKVKLSWNKPKDDGGSRVTHYIIEWQDRGSDSWEPCQVNGADDTEVTLDDFNKDMKYRIKAVNMEGESGPLEVVGDVKDKNENGPPPLILSLIHI